jgi:DNA-binding response OmpR family regulator
MKILIVEDDKDTAEFVRMGLSADSHTVEVADNGVDGSFMAKSFDYDAIVLDYALPRRDGLAVCKDIRAAGRSTPIVFLSATGDASLKVSAFDHGADDYVTKPFSLVELSARIRAVTRRPAVMAKPTLAVEDLTMDLEHFTVWRAGRRVRLTRKEFNLLEYLMRRRGTVLSRAILMEHVWTADSDPFSNTVETHIRNLRKKLNGEDLPNLIANIPGRGYVIDAPEDLKRL